MPARLLTPALLVPLLVGCGAPQPAVIGTVTIDGRPLRDGYITFFPTEGTANTCGAPVTDGRYRIDEMPPGPRRVVVSSTPDVRAAGRPVGAPVLNVVPTADRVSPKAKGNQRVVEIRPGPQALDFALENPVPQR